MLNTI